MPSQGKSDISVQENRDDILADRVRMTRSCIGAILELAQAQKLIDTKTEDGKSSFSELLLSFAESAESRLDHATTTYSLARGDEISAQELQQVLDYFHSSLRDISQEANKLNPSADTLSKTISQFNHDTQDLRRRQLLEKAQSAALGLAQFRDLAAESSTLDLQSRQIMQTFYQQSSSRLNYAIDALHNASGSRLAIREHQLAQILDSLDEAKRSMTDKKILEGNSLSEEQLKSLTQITENFNAQTTDLFKTELMSAPSRGDSASTSHEPLPSKDELQKMFTQSMAAAEQALLTLRNSTKHSEEVADTCKKALAGLSSVNKICDRLPNFLKLYFLPVLIALKITMMLIKNEQKKELQKKQIAERKINEIQRTKKLRELYQRYYEANSEGKFKDIIEEARKTDSQISASDIIPVFLDDTNPPAVRFMNRVTGQPIGDTDFSLGSTRPGTSLGMRVKKTVSLDTETGKITIDSMPTDDTRNVVQTSREHIQDARTPDDQAKIDEQKMRSDTLEQQRSIDPHVPTAVTPPSSRQ